MSNVTTHTHDMETQNKMVGSLLPLMFDAVRGSFDTKTVVLCVDIGEPFKKKRRARLTFKGKVPTESFSVYSIFCTENRRAAVRDQIIQTQTHSQTHPQTQDVGAHLHRTDCTLRQTD